MPSKSWASKAVNVFIGATFVLAALMASHAHVQTQAPFLVFGQSSGSAQVIKATSNALWASIQGGPVQSPLQLPDGTAVAPSLTDVNQTNTGLYFVPASNGLAITAHGTSVGAFDDSPAFRMVSTGYYGFESGAIFSGAPDVRLYRDAASTLALKNGTNLQTFRVYDASGSTFSYLSGVLAAAPKHISTTAAPSLSSCGTGTIDSNSNDFAGKVTATGATACTVTFTTAYPTAAWCVITDDTTIGKALISAQSASAFTVSSLTSGDAFTYVCGGK